MFTRTYLWGLLVMGLFLTIYQFGNQCAIYLVRNSSLFLQKITTWPLGLALSLLRFVSDFCFFFLFAVVFFCCCCFYVLQLIVPITRLWVSLFHRNSGRRVWMGRRIENTPWSMENYQSFGWYSSFFNWNMAKIIIYWLLFNDSTNAKEWHWFNAMWKRLGYSSVMTWWIY